MTCILNERNRKGCDNCAKTCAHRIALSGLNGQGGRIASAGVPAKYRHLTVASSPVRESEPEVYKLVDEYIKSFKDIYD